VSQQTSNISERSAALLAGAAGATGHYHSLHGSFTWNNAGSMAHIPVAKQTVLHGVFKTGELTNWELRILASADPPELCLA
jgi:hypothetical protein